ncbi:chaperonin 10-like protein [Dactylonectria estremocensis]|uniref:Chaperonin 10-like protein n=1 Tax=Dactylonectria estremocensis TaxID=1079267 RepID=A0A9P9EQM4_9HYPO|nr:chaperonin 10-like protein [Dactylonectria estremocensis]
MAATSRTARAMLARAARSSVPALSCTARITRFGASLNNNSFNSSHQFTRRYLSSMKALVYNAVNSVSLQDRPVPAISSPTDVIVKITKTTICGTDLHITKGDVATCQPGRILGHEGVGIVQSVGSSVNRFKEGDRVLISCISSCATCEYCRKGMHSHCTSGGWILGNTIDGTQAEFVRIPHADSSLYPIPKGADEAALVMLSDIFPTGLECGVLNGKVQPGGSVVIVGSGPIGLASIITAQMYSPAKIIAIDTDARRLKVAKELGATEIIDSTKEDPIAKVKALTDGKGCDSVIEAVGIPATFGLCQELLAPGGVLANVGVHGTKVDLHLENLWDKNISITTRLVDAVSTPMLLKMVEAGKLQPSQLITHRFKFSEMEKAYETFGKASEHGALKVVIEVD